MHWQISTHLPVLATPITYAFTLLSWYPPSPPITHAFTQLRIHLRRRVPIPMQQPFYIALPTQHPYLCTCREHSTPSPSNPIVLSTLAGTVIHEQLAHGNTRRCFDRQTAVSSKSGSTWPTCAATYAASSSVHSAMLLARQAVAPRELQTTDQQQQVNAHSLLLLCSLTWTIHSC